MSTERRKTPAVPPTTLPSGARRVEPPDVLRSEKGRRVIRELLGSRVYKDLVQGKRDPLDVEDALAEALKARAARLRRSAGSTAVETAQVTALQEGAEVLGEILAHRNARVAMMQAAMEEGP